MDTARSLHDRYRDVVLFVESSGWKDEVLPAIAKLGTSLTKELVEGKSDPSKDAMLKGKLQALKWVVELPAFLAKTLQGELQLMTPPPINPSEFGHPYGPTPEGADGVSVHSDRTEA